MVLTFADGTLWLPPNQETHAYSSSWSPDGRQLVIQQYDGLYLVNLAGPDQTPHLIPNTDNSFTTPSWSPDGKRIVVTYRNHEQWDIGAINPDGSNFALLTYDPAATSPTNNASATWSANGHYIVFASDRAGAWQLYAMNPDGSSVTPLSSQTVVYEGSMGRVVAWKPGT
jgi:TolB protein